MKKIVIPENDKLIKGFLIEEEELAEHDAKVKADAIEEVKSKMISFHTDAIFQYGADIIEARADAFDELKDWLDEQMKEQKNG